MIAHVRRPKLPGPPEQIHPLFPVEYGLQGSLGWMAVYDHFLTRAELEKLLALDKAGPSLLEEIAAPKFPSGGGEHATFGAFYTTLTFDKAWDETRRSGPDSDVVVRFADLPTRLVFWEGTNYVPAWVTENNRWYSDEFLEVYGRPRCPDGEDCEPMSDKQSRYSRVRILESGPARAVIHWRYALSEVEK